MSFILFVFTFYFLVNVPNARVPGPLAQSIKGKKCEAFNIQQTNVSRHCMSLYLDFRLLKRVA